MRKQLVRLSAGWPSGLAAVVAVGVLAPVALGLAWLVAGSVSSPLRADAATEPLVMPVGAADRNQSVSVLLTVEYDDPFEVTATGAGLITGVHVDAGDEVAAGDALVSVDDQVRVAFTGPAPLWRDIGLGVEGDDVERVREFLAEQGFPAGTVPGRVTAATAEGIRQFNQSVGRGAGDRTLRRETLLWVGPEPMVVDVVVTSVGEAVSDGAPLVTGPRRPVRVEVEVPDQRTWPEGDYELVVSDVAVPYDPGRGTVDDPQDVRAAAAALGADEGAGSVRLVDAAPVGTLPAAAVVTDDAGRTCVFESATGPPVPVDVSGGSLSTVEVPADWVGRSVLVNPREVREDLSCG